MEFTFLIPTILGIYFYLKNKKKDIFIRNQNEIVRTHEQNLFVYLSIISEININNLDYIQKRILHNLKKKIVVDKRLLIILTENNSSVNFVKAASYFCDNSSEAEKNIIYFVLAKERLEKNKNKSDWKVAYNLINKIIKESGKH